jgi:uncharacterized protein YodC (DUF2158 family)
VSYKVGDLVRMKSGGPVMCVESIMSPDTVSATWFKPYELNKTNQWFPIAMLRKAEEHEVPWSDFAPRSRKDDNES